MDAQSFEGPHPNMVIDNFVKPFSHKNEEKGRERVPLMDASGAREGHGGGTIEKNGEYRGGDKTRDPSNLGRAKFEGRQHLMNV